MSNKFEQWWNSLTVRPTEPKEIARHAYSKGVDDAFDEIKCRCNTMQNSTPVILTGLFCAIMWISGIVLAKGVWQTIFALIPFYAWYLVIERIFLSWGIL